MNILVHVALVGLFACFASSATAEKSNNAPNVGVGVVCETAQQIERLVAIQAQDTTLETAIQAVNNESNYSSACGVATIAFIFGNEIERVKVPGGDMRIVQITIIAIALESGWHKIPATVQYTAIFEKAVEV